MNLLIDLVPNSIEVGGKNYDINSDFRVSVLFEMMMSDDELTEREKVQKALELYYPIIPDNINEAIKKMLWFYRCGKESKAVTGEGNGMKREQIYNYEYDDKYIYSAFVSQYNINLQSIPYLHWWEFKSLFDSLSQDNLFVKIMHYRSVDINSIQDKEQKAYYRRLKKIYSLPTSEKEAKKIEAIEDALMKGEDIRNLI